MKLILLYWIALLIPNCLQMERELDSTSAVKSTFSLDTLRLTFTANGERSL